MKEGMSFRLRALEAALRDKKAGWLINFALIPALLILAIVLPPISLVDRVSAAGFTSITLQGGAVLDPDGTQLTILPEGLTQRVKVSLTSIPRLDFLAGKAGNTQAAQSIPDYLEMKSPFYLLEVRGAMPQANSLTIPIPNDAEPLSTLDLYAWTGQEWRWIPHTIILEDDVIEGYLTSLPKAVAVMQTKPRAASVVADLEEGAVLGAEAELLSGISIPGLFLQSDGYAGGSTIGGVPVAPAQSEDVTFLAITNEMGGVVRDDLTQNILIEANLRASHIQEIVGLVVANGYSGVSIEYRGVDASLKDEFTAFIAGLAEQLHSQGKLLTLRVAPPVQIAEDRWDTGGYDWRALGEVVDGLQVPAMAKAEAYAPGGEMEALLNYTVGQVDRYKIGVILSTYARDQMGEREVSLPYQEALQLLGREIAFSSEEVQPGETVTVNPAPSGGINYLAEPQAYWFPYTDEGGEHKVWLENAESIARKLILVQAFNLQGVRVDGLLEDKNDQRVWDALREYASAVPPSTKNEFAFLWQVKDEAGGIVGEGETSMEQPAFSWTVPAAGQYTVSFAISDDGGATASAAGGEAVLVALAPTPTPTPTPIPVAPTPTPKPATTQPTPTPVPVRATGPGPGFAYAIQVELEAGGSQVIAAAKELRMTWVKEQIRWKEVEPSPGNIEWARLDAMVDLVQGAGVNLLFSVVSSPSWVNWAQTDPKTPADFSAYANFVGALAGRYCGRVQAYEIWNEENLLREWYGHVMSPAQYVGLLQAAYTSIKTACPQALVISGAPTPAGDTSASIDDVSYLSQAYDAGLGRWCDGVGVHPSGFANPPDSKVGTSTAPSHNNHRSFFYRETMESYRQVIVAHGDVNKRLWPTEFGWGVSSSPHPGYEYEVNNTWELQAQYIVRAFEMARDWGWVGPMFLWNLNWATFQPQEECAAFSIVGPGWSQRPAYWALANRP